MVEELDQRRVSPVQIFDDEHKRTLSGNGFEKALPGGERLLAGNCYLGRFGADQWREPPAEPVAVGFVFDERVDRRAELRSCVCGTVRFEDPRMRLDDLAQGPERDSFAIREATALTPEDELGLSIDEPLELCDQSRLADTRLAGHRH